MPKSPKDSVRRLLTESWENPALQAELMAPQITCHVASYPKPLEGVERYSEFQAAYRSVLGDVHFTVEDLLMEGDRVAARWTAWLGEGEAPSEVGSSEDPVAVMGISIFRFEGDRIVESWESWDSLSLLAHDPDVLEKLSFTL
ncbi:MAG: ester cyclase [Gammaproteobacteria bacterium]|nr:ester cyclase [Gammaproteobacteria bacterium]